MVTADPWLAFVDAFDPGVAGPYVAHRAVLDVDLPSAAPCADGLRVVLTGGAGQLAGPVDFCARHEHLRLAALDTALRDLEDPAGNARRVATAATDLPEGVALHVRVGAREPTSAWLGALDVLAEVEAVVALPLDRLAADPGRRSPVEPWIDAALDRELAVSLVGGGLTQAADALRSTARLWGDADDLASARSWCRCWLPEDAEAEADAVTRLAAGGPRRAIT